MIVHLPKLEVLYNLLLGDYVYSEIGSFIGLPITSVIEVHKEEILLHPTWTESKSGAADENQPRSAKAFILSPLPGPLNELNSVTLKTIIVGLVKDLVLHGIHQSRYDGLQNSHSEILAWHQRTITVSQFSI